jgi:hypothetical protein
MAGIKAAEASRETQLKTRLLALNRERKQIKTELKLIDGQRTAAEDLQTLRSSGEPTVFVYEKSSNVAAYLLSIREELEKDGIEIETNRLEYWYTVERTGRDGLDSDNTQWNPLDEDCTCETDEQHGLRFDDEKLPPEIKTDIHIDTFNVKAHRVINKWEHGTEYEHGHAYISDLVGTALASTWKMMEPKEETEESDEE